MPQDVSAWSLSLPLPNFLRPAQPQPQPVQPQPVAMPRDGYVPAANRPAPNADPFADVQKLYQELMAVQDEAQRLAQQPPQQPGFRPQPQPPVYQPQPPVYQPQPQPPVYQPQPQPQPQQAGQPRFVDFDKDHNNVLDFNEILAVQDNDVDAAVLLFNKADRNNDAVVDGREWTLTTGLPGPDAPARPATPPAPVPQQPAPRPQQPTGPAQPSNDPDFQRADRNRDNLLDFDELMASANGDVDQAVAIFNKADTDGNAKISASEWAHWRSFQRP